MVVFLLSRKGGVHAILQAFPCVPALLSALADDAGRRIRILASAVDDGLEERLVSTEKAGSEGKQKKIWAITPGMGDIGHRFFG